MFKSSWIFLAVIFAALDLVSNANAVATTAEMEPVVVTADPLPPLPNQDDESWLSRQRLLTLQVKSPDDLSGLSPNLATLGGGSRGLDTVTSARGLANSPTFTDPAVVYYVDGVPSDAALLNSFDWHEVESLDIWKGPQEIRFGQNAPAGVIEIESDRPKPYFSSTASIDYGSYNLWDAFGELTGPIPGSDVSVLASIHASARDGYLTNTRYGTHPDDQNEIGGRFALRWAPARTPWTFDLNVAQTNDDDGVQRFTPLGGPRFEISSFLDGYSHIQNGVQSLRARYEGDEVETTLISSHRSYALGPNLLDIGFGTIPFPTLTTASEDQYTQEVRVASKGNEAFQWFGGASYQRIGFQGTEDTGGLTTTAIDTTYDQYAAFGNVTVHPAEKLSLTLGNRFQADAKEATRDDTFLFAPATSDRQQRTWLNFAPKIEASYDVFPQIRAFASTGLAFRPGGYAPFPSTTTLVEPYGSERTWANEIGVSYEAPEQHFKTVATLFWNETYGYQLERYRTPLVDVVNVPEVASRGAEWQMELQPADGLILSATVGCTLATFVDYHDGVTGQDYSGLHVPYIPQATWLVEATYRHPRGWTAHVDVRGLGDTDFSQANSLLYRQDAYALLNSRVGYEAARWAVYLYGQNLTNTQYDTMIDPSLNIQVPGAPRTVGIEAKTIW